MAGTESGREASGPLSRIPQPRSSTWVDRIVAAVTPRGPDEPPATTGAPTHADLRQRNDRAASAFCAGRYAEADEGFTAVLAHCRAVLGEDHPDTLVAAGNLAAARVRAGHPEQVLGLLEHAIDARTRAWGAGHPATLDVRNALGVALLETGDPTAANVLRDVLAARSEHLGITHPDTEETRELLARADDHERDITRAF